MPLAVEQDESLDLDAGLLCAISQMLDSPGVDHLVREAWLNGAARSSQRNGGKLRIKSRL